MSLFEGNILNLIYLVALLLGVVYAFILLVFQGIGDVFGDLDLHLGDTHFDLHAGHSHEAAGISMLAIASFVTMFGALGLFSVIAFDVPALAGLTVATIGGLVFGIIGHLFFIYVLSVTVSSEVIQSNLIGMTAEITIPIPSHGVGQIAFVAKGSRVTYPARAVESENSYTRGTPVRIERIVGGIAYVNALD